MDSILEGTQLIFFPEQENNNYSEIYEEGEKVSLWLTDTEIIRPSTNITIQNKLNPGIYYVGVSRDYGIYCRKASNTSDELIKFSDSIVNNLVSEINSFWDKKDLYKHNKLIHKRGILLEGYPGTGKTSIISILSNEIMKRNGVVFILDSPRNVSTYIDFLRYSFRVIEPDTPIISIIEDLDKFESDDQLLDFFDGKSSIEHHVIIATTNNSKSISNAYLRPSRIDLRIVVDLPSDKTREEFFKIKNIPSELIPELVIRSKDFSLADLKELYIAIFLLGYSTNEAFLRFSTTKKKKDYSSKPLNSSPLGI